MEPIPVASLYKSACVHESDLHCLDALIILGVLIIVFLVFGISTICTRRRFNRRTQAVSPGGEANFDV
ncbi:hypothetical protein L596_007616 [Steinernema carpocapsae]|uniref:Uncharacterized protein n=1 Tax=Steinernema carpocapsae TaxID=34508 RepID=A0A4U5PAH0_STECR|nr:hypothetical protein L596_007616 [Steinernema carpocapsae]